MMFTVTDHGLDHQTHKRKVTVEIDERELATLHLDRWDTAVLDEVKQGLSDVFHDWELLARRWE